MARSQTYKLNDIKPGSRSSKRRAAENYSYFTQRETPHQYWHRITWQCAYERRQPNWANVPADLQEEMLGVWWEAIDSIDPTFAAQYEARLAVEAA